MYIKVYDRCMYIHTHMEQNTCNMIGGCRLSQLSLNTQDILDRNILVIGSRMTGKTTLVIDGLCQLLYPVIDQSFLITGDDLDNIDDKYRQMIPNIHNIKHLEHIVQYINKSHDGHTLIIMEQTTHIQKGSRALADLVFNGRHRHVTLIIVEQYVRMPPELRSNVDYVLYSAREYSHVSHAKTIYEHYFGNINDYSMFINILKACNEISFCYLSTGYTPNGSGNGLAFYYLTSEQINNAKHQLMGDKVQLQLESNDTAKITPQLVDQLNNAIKQLVGVRDQLKEHYLL